MDREYYVEEININIEKIRELNLYTSKYEYITFSFNEEVLSFQINCKPELCIACGKIFRETKDFKIEIELKKGECTFEKANFYENMWINEGLARDLEIKKLNKKQEIKYIEFCDKHGDGEMLAVSRLKTKPCCNKKQRRYNSFVKLDGTRLVVWSE